MERGMKPEFNSDPKWERWLDRQLKDMPPLTAPPSVLAQVMAAVARHEQPWYRRSWQQWPLSLQVGTALALSLVFAGICFAGWRVPTFGPVASGLDTARSWWSTGCVWFNALGALAEAGRLVVKNLGSGFVIGCLVALGLAYATCLGLGTVYVRLAMPRR